MKLFRFFSIQVSMLCLLASCVNDSASKSQAADNTIKQIADIHQTFLLANTNNDMQLELTLENGKVKGTICKKTDLTKGEKSSRMSEGSLICQGEGLDFARCVDQHLKRMEKQQSGSGCVVIRTCLYCAYECN